VKPAHKNILIWQIAGAGSLLIVGSLLHFAYEWSGNSPIVGVFSAVNESVWEHLKLGFWSLFLYSAVEYWFIRRKTHNYLAAKAAGILTLQIFIVAFFYIYTAIAREEIFILDILSYVVGCVLCQMVSYRILRTAKPVNPLNAAGILVLALHAIALGVFTFMPPKLPIFRDAGTGGYGISDIPKAEED
jgi:hypothetical protein